MILFIFLFTATAVPAEDKAPVVTVGVFQLAPLVYIDDKGSPKGVFVDLIEAIAQEEGWTVAYAKGTWNEGLEKVRNGRIDLMTAVMHLPRRDAFLDFPKASVFNIWGQLYIHKDAKISGIFDMEGKTVGVLNGGANGENFIGLLGKLGIPCEVIPFDSQEATAEAISQKRVDAGVFTNIHGYNYQQSHPLKATQIVFDPSFLKYAVAEASNQQLVSTIDAYLSKWKSDQNSVYHRIIEKHLGRSESKKIPGWVWWLASAGAGTLGFTLVAAFILVVFNKKLKTDVMQATQDLKTHAQKLERMNEQLKVKNTELDEFTYFASHDLQEPLRKITAFSSLLQMDLGDDLSEDAQENLYFLTDAASRMQTLVNDLLTLSRSGRQALKNEMISINACIDEATRSLDLLIAETGTKIIRDDLPEIWGDKTTVTQLFQNLINNGIKFSKVNPIIEITAQQTDLGLVLGVRDNGIGIQEQYQEQIFAPFKRLHGRGEYSGTGIGLSICRKVVERHNGKIWVESELKKGSHFKFILSPKKAIEK
ncbi:MAG: transporter substrate-binding domain-containing protein [Desulfobacterium sp.]|nr:transporter substrate-binding domain-containing protein [Desulfobacterium sp.]